jgi:hypothetical protein
MAIWIFDYKSIFGEWFPIGMIAHQNFAFFAPPPSESDSDLRLARSTFTKPDFKIIARRGARGSHWAIRQQRRILDSLPMTGRQRVRIGSSDGIVRPPLDFSRKLCHYRDCIKSRAAALANLPHRARWWSHKDAAVTGNQTGLIMEYPEQTIKRLTQRLGRVPTPEEIKAERDMLMRALYGSLLLAEISFAGECCANKTATARSCRRSSSSP